MYKLSFLAAFLLLLNLTCFAQSTKEDEGNNKGNTENKKTYAELMRYAEPSESEYGRARQLTELGELEKEAKATKADWEDVASSLKSAAESLAKDDDEKYEKEWKAIQSEPITKSSRSGIRFRINVIIEEFETNYAIGDYYYENRDVNRFVEDVGAEITKVIKEFLPNDIEQAANDMTRLLSREEVPANEYNTLLNKLSQHYNDTNYKELNQRIKKVLETKTKEAEAKLQDADGLLLAVSESMQKISEVKSKDLEINHLGIMWGIPAFCVTIVALFFGATFAKRIFKATSKADDEDFDDYNEQITKVLLEIITVFLLTLTVLILGLSRILTENVLGTLLGGIAGYILNRSGQNALQAPAAKPAKTQVTPTPLPTPVEPNVPTPAVNPPVTPDTPL